MAEIEPHNLPLNLIHQEVATQACSTHSIKHKKTSLQISSLFVSYERVENVPSRSVCAQTMGAKDWNNSM